MGRLGVKMACLACGEEAASVRLAVSSSSLQQAICLWRVCTHSRSVCVYAELCVYVV